MAYLYEKCSPTGSDGSSSPLSSLPDSSPIKLPPLEDITISSPVSANDQAMHSRAKKKKAAPKRTPRKSKWNAENILIDEKSPLATADLRNILLNPMAWDILSGEEKAQILALFPDEEHITAGNDEAEACFNRETLLSDDSFRRDCAAYTRNIADGKHDPEWLQSAWSAHERRKMGDFDEFLVNEFENDWDVELPENFKPCRNSTADATRSCTAACTAASASSEGSINGSKEGETDDQEVHARTELDQATTKEEEMRSKTLGEIPNGSTNGSTPNDSTTKSSNTNGSNTNGSTKTGSIMHEEAIDELQAEEESREENEEPPVKRQKKSSAKEAESEDELA